MNQTFDNAHANEMVNEELRMVKAKLSDTIELLHLWKNEAFAFRHLVEVLVAGRFSLEEAKKLLAYPIETEPENECEFVNEKSGTEGTAVGFEPLSIYYSLLTILSFSESDAFLAMAKKAQLSPVEFLWACVESTMNNGDDPDVLNGCREAVHKRFRDEVLPDWVVTRGVRDAT